MSEHLNNWNINRDIEYTETCRRCGGTGKSCDFVNGVHMMATYDTCPLCEGNRRVVLKFVKPWTKEPVHDSH